MEKYLSTYGEVLIGINTENTTNCIFLKTKDATLGRAEAEQVMQEWANENDYGEVQDAYEYVEGCWSARILD